jgi:hypothetical protein
MNMNESLRTVIFAGVSLLVGVVAWFSQSHSSGPTLNTSEEIVKPFDATDAASLKIVRYDADDGKVVTFEVAKDGGRWTIPSHDGYPADAEAQLQKVAGLFTGMKAVGNIITSNPLDHGLYGVKEPSSDDTSGGKDVGRRVTIADAGGEALVDLIVGKAAKAEDDDKTASGRSLRFVRRAGQDAVYVVEVSLDALTTKFEDWIERDLLKLNAFDVAKLDLQDYSLIPTQVGNRVRMVYMPRMETLVSWDAGASQWKLDRMTVHSREGDPLQGELSDDEELNKAKLDGVKTAVDDLKIIDVERKPKVLFEALKDEQLARDQQAVGELQQFGFYVLQDPETRKLQVKGMNGGVQISMKDGVRYVLNFGDAKSAEKGDSSKLNRFLMVRAEIDEALLPKPTLEPEDEPLGPDAKDDSDMTDAADGEKSESADRSNADEGSAKNSADDEAKDEAQKKRREQIKKENKRKMDEYHDKRQAAEGRVAELNARFNDWFYVVSDDVYRKVQLGRADIVKDRDTAKDEGFGVDAFRKLEAGGVEGKAAASTPPPPPGNIPRFPGQ